MEENCQGPQTTQADKNVEEKKSHDSQELDDLQKDGKDSKGWSGKRGKRKLGASGSPGSLRKPKTKEFATPLNDRPARERKSVERFSDSVEKEKEKPKEVKIEQGSGTYLSDIPNVVFKLSKRKASDEVVQLLHKLLYNKRVKPYHVKSNILQFSGFIWGPNEEKEKTRVKEKLQKIVKENLFHLGDLLDLSITKTIKKEDVVLRVFEFLECPHKTTEVLVQEQLQAQKEKKRGKTPTKGKRKRSSNHTPQKRQRKEQIEVDQEEPEGNQKEEVDVEPEEEEPEEVPVKKITIKIKPSLNAKSSSAKASNKSIKSRALEGHAIKEPKECIQEAEAEHEKDYKEPTQKHSRDKKMQDDAASTSPKQGFRKPVRPKSGYEPREHNLKDDAKDVKSKPRSKSSKKEIPKETKTSVARLTKQKNNASTSLSKATSRKKKKGDYEDAAESNAKMKMETSKLASKREPEAPRIPVDEDLRPAICELLRDADFNTVTFTDVVKRLGAKFNMDLSLKKAHVKILIQEEISKMIDEDDGDGDDEETGVTTLENRENSQ